ESEKSEIARQILLSFLVKSVHQNADAVDEPKVSERKVENFENSSDEVAKDSAVIKIMYGTEENNKTVVNSSDDIEEQENSEGFVYGSTKVDSVDKDATYTLQSCGFKILSDVVSKFLAM
ncbi:clustered mitochondria protein-like, partial [Trifolium medium]|nr:clustered mitochondria protein-like [Trifolium medium]